jgi:hypothetical protein
MRQVHMVTITPFTLFIMLVGALVFGIVIGHQL